MDSVATAFTALKMGRRKIGLLSMLVLFAAVFGAGVVSSQRAAAIPLSPSHIVATDADSCNKAGFLGLRPWYAFLPDSSIGIPQKGRINADPCGIRCFNIFVQAAENECGQKASDVPGVVLAVIDDLLRIAGLVAVVFIIVGAFQYVGSRGNSERTAGAQSTIINALTGLAIALVAVAFISYLGNQLGG